MTRRWFRRLHGGMYSLPQPSSCTVMLDTRPSSEQNAALLSRDGAQRRLPSHSTLHRRSHLLLRKSESDKRRKRRKRTKNEKKKRTKKLTYIDVLGRGRARFALAWRVLEGAAQIAEHRLITKLVLRGTRRGFGGGERTTHDAHATHTRRPGRFGYLLRLGDHAGPLVAHVLHQVHKIDGRRRLRRPARKTLSVPLIAKCAN